jgi:hypothetical protein
MNLVIPSQVLFFQDSGANLGDSNYDDDPDAVQIHEEYVLSPATLPL